MACDKKFHRRPLPWIFAVLLFLAACSGKSNLNDPLDDVPDENISAGLEGYWTLSATVTESDCEEIRVGESLPDSPVLKVRQGGCSLEDTSGLGGETFCEAGGATIGARSTLDIGVGDCRVDGQENLLLNYSEETTSLTGETEFVITLSGNCPSEVRERFGDGCRVKADVTAGHVVGLLEVPVSSPSSPGDPASELEIPVPSDPVLESPPEPAVEPTADSTPEAEDGSEPTGPRIVFNPAVIQWMIRMCEGVDCREEERCFFGRCFERE